MPSDLDRQKARLARGLGVESGYAVDYADPHNPVRKLTDAETKAVADEYAAERKREAAFAKLLDDEDIAGEAVATAPRERK